MKNTPNKIIWHHSADSFAGNQFYRINEAHKLRAFPMSRLGYYVGYHYVVEKSGEVKKARWEEEVGAHDAGENVNSLGICLAGNFSIGLPSLEQEEAVALLLGQIMKRWNIPLSRVEPHRWGDTTECPGVLLHDYWLAFTHVKWEYNWLERLVYKYLTKRV